MKFPKGLSSNFICTNSLDVTEIDKDNTTLTLIAGPVNISWRPKHQVNVNIAKVVKWIEGIVWPEEA
jgi:hypothetical protein